MFLLPKKKWLYFSQKKNYELTIKRDTLLDSKNGNVLIGFTTEHIYKTR